MYIVGCPGWEIRRSTHRESAGERSSRLLRLVGSLLDNASRRALAQPTVAILDVGLAGPLLNSTTLSERVDRL